MSESLRYPQVFFIVMLFIAVLGFNVYAVVQHQRQVSSTGQFKRIGVEVWDGYAKVNRIESIDWGEIDLNVQNYSLRDIYIESTSTGNIVLRIIANNTQPTEFAQYMTLTSDYNGTQILSGEVIKVTLKLIVDDKTPWNLEYFSFDIWVIGERGGG